VVDQYGYTPLSLAVEHENPDLGELLLMHKAHPDMPDGKGATPLKTAIDMKRADLTEILLEGGAQPTVESKTFLLNNKRAIEFLEKLNEHGIVLPKIVESDGPKVASAFKDELKNVLITIMGTTPHLTLTGAHEVFEHYIKVRNEITAEQAIPRKVKAYRILRDNPQYNLDQVKAAL